jgi:AAA domain
MDNQDWLVPTAVNRFDARTLPRREWLYGRSHIRRFLVATIAPGGLAKTTLTVSQSLAMATGQDLLGAEVPKPLRVWYWNGEDPREELERKFIASAQHYKIDLGTLTDRMFFDSGRESKSKFKIATVTSNGIEIDHEAVDRIKEHIIRFKIDVFHIDPLISAHSVPESNNNGMDVVTKVLGGIADEANCCVSMVHHTRKQSGSEAMSVDDSRGASAVTNTARNVLMMGWALPTDKARPPGDHVIMVRDGKPNLTAMGSNLEYYQVKNVRLENGDDVGVMVRLRPHETGSLITPEIEAKIADIAAGQKFRFDPQSTGWLGHSVAPLFGMDSFNDKKIIKGELDALVKKGILTVIEAGDGKRMKRKFYEAGHVASP